VEGGEGEDLERGEGADDEEYEREAPPPSPEDHCDWALANIGDILN
jgi:hypothetical protein